jgi:hypothetical protein
VVCRSRKIGQFQLETRDTRDESTWPKKRGAGQAGVKTFAAAATVTREQRMVELSGATRQTVRVSALMNVPELLLL